MARLGIKRANGDIEYAELTTDKSLVGSHYLTVEKDGTPYYAKLDDNVSTHLCVEGSDGQKRYVQKEVKFVWKYIFDNTWENASKMVIPRTGKYKLTFTTYDYSGDTNNETFTKDDIFNQGDRFNYANEYCWFLKAKSGKKYLSYEFSDNGVEPGTPMYSAVYTVLDFIEYIGEA